MSSISSIHGAMDGKFLKTLTVGKPNFATGKIRIDGTTSGRVTITTAAAAGTWTLTLPGTGGTADYVLSTDGAGAASWISGQSIAGLKTTSTPQFLRLGLNQAADAVASLAATQTAIGVTSTDGYVLQNTTAAAAGAQQYSPRIRLTGQGWKTNATAASQTVDWIVENQPVQGAANPTTNLVFSSQVNAAGYVTQLTLQSGVNALFAGTGQMTRLGLGAAADANVVAWLQGASVNKLTLHDTGAGRRIAFQVNEPSFTTFGYRFYSDSTTGFYGFYGLSSGNEDASPTIGWLRGSGNVTIGSTTTTGMFNVGTSAQFQVSSTGMISTTGVGPHAIGGATDSTVAWFQRGTFNPGAGASYLTLLQATVNANSNQPTYGFYNNPTLVEAGSGDHSVEAFATFTGTITNGAATATNAINVDIATFAAATGTTNATGLRVAAPTGATNNYAINVTSGDIYKAGTAYNNPAWVFEHFYSGAIVQFADRFGAAGYEGLPTLRAVESFCREHYELPQMARFKKGGMFDRGEMLLASVEQSFLYLFQHDDTIKTLERENQELRRRVAILEAGELR